MVSARKVISWRFAIFAAVLHLSFACNATAQVFPSRPITIVVPFTAGGPADTAARSIVESLQRQLGQPVVLENRPAASGIVGTEAIALGAQDGYTLLLGGIAALALVPPVQQVRYVVERDLAPLGLLWRSPQVFAVRASLDVTNVAAFVRQAKASPGKITIGSAGNGTVTHLAGELLKRESGIELLHVPYRSTANSLTDLVGGHIDAIFGDVAILKPHVQSGAIRALAITSPERSLLLPDVATMQEMGFPRVQTEVWYGLLASSQAPQHVLDRLRGAMLAAQGDAAFVDALKRYSINPPIPGSDYFAKFIHSEIERWTPIVKAIGPQ